VGNALPLTPEELKSVAIVGPTAGQIAAGFLGERAYGFEARVISPLAGLTRIAGRAGIAYSAAVDLTGAPIPDSALSLDGIGKQDDARTGTLTVPEDG